MLLLEGSPALEHSEGLVPKAGRQAAPNGLATGLQNTKSRFCSRPRVSAVDLQLGVLQPVVPDINAEQQQEAACWIQVGGCLGRAEHRGGQIEFRV